MKISIRDTILILAFAPAAHAVLGGSESTIDGDRTAIKAETRTLQTSSSYRVHVLSVAGTNVREYVTTDGTVFAVTWSGQTRPDLSTLLGSSYQEYRAEKAKVGKIKGRKNVPVSTSGLVVRHSGHMGAIRGQAYLPNLVPSGVDAGSLP